MSDPHEVCACCSEKIAQLDVRAKHTFFPDAASMRDGINGRSAIVCLSCSADPQKMAALREVTLSKADG